MGFSNNSVELVNFLKRILAVSGGLWLHDPDYIHCFACNRSQPVSRFLCPLFEATSPANRTRTVRSSKPYVMNSLGSFTAKLK